MIQPGIYEGTLRHRRHQTRGHQFRYRVMMALLDIDRLPELMQVSPLAGYNRAAVFSYQERDHFGDPSQTLRQRIMADAEAQGVPQPAGKIFLLTNLRSYGYTFNPVSYYYCLDEVGKLAAVMAEVNNTFGETCNYWLTPQQEVPAGNSKRYRFPKRFHVSPFFGLNQIYDWTITPPGAMLTIQCMNFEGGELAFPEYGGRGYKMAAGGAVVFSGSLLHAVNRVTQGRRYAFLPFLYDEAAAGLRRANLSLVG